MQAFMAMVGKELKAVTRERTIMIAIVIQLLIASFSSVIVVGLIAYYDPESIAIHTQATLRAGILGDPGSMLTTYLRDKRVTVNAFASSDEAEAAFEAGIVDCVLHIPPVHDGVADLQLFLPESESRATVILMVLKEPLSRYENDLRQAAGVELHYADVAGDPPTTYEFLYASIIPILLFFPAFIAGSMVVDSIAEEFEHHTLDTLLSAPVTIHTVLGSKMAASLVLAAIQCLLWMLLLRLNHIYIQHPLTVLALAILVAALNALIAAFCGTYLRDRERSQFTYSLFIVIFVSGSYLLNASPISTLTRLATGDPTSGPANLFVYLATSAILALLYFASARKLMAAKA